MVKHNRFNRRYIEVKEIRGAYALTSTLTQAAHMHYICSTQTQIKFREAAVRALERFPQVCTELDHEVCGHAESDHVWSWGGARYD